MLVAPVAWIPDAGAFGSGGGPPPVLPDPPPIPVVTPTPAGQDAYGSWLWPEGVYPESYTLLPQSFTLVSESPLTRRRRFVRLTGGDRWIYEMQFRHERRINQKIEALIARLRGPLGRVAIWDLDRENPLGPALDWSNIARTRFTDETQFTDGTRFSGGSAQGFKVYGNWQRGDEEIRAYGFPQNSIQLVGADQIGLNGRLYRLTRDAESDGLGIARLYLHRGLLTDVAHKTQVVTYRPTSPFQLADDDQSARSRSALGLPMISLRFIEAL